MLYRIRYRKPGKTGDAEMAVEAGSPNEAMVKFQCTCDCGTSGRDEGKVTSVRAEENYQELKP